MNIPDERARLARGNAADCRVRGVNDRNQLHIGEASDQFSQSGCEKRRTFHQE
jgi:hypothetical protein